MRMGPNAREMKKEEKKLLLTFRRPQVGKGLQLEIPPLPTLK